MVEVCFVLMPYVDVERPSIAMGLLKAALNGAGITSKVIYANLQFAEQLGLEQYKYLGGSLAAHLMGEWTFSGTAFPDFQSDNAKYFQLLELSPDRQELLWDIRHQTVSFVDQVARQVLELQPQIVSCSSMFQQHCASLALLRRIRELSPETITLMGGANCEGIMGVATHQEFPWVDFVASGEGDSLFAELCSLILTYGRDVDPKQLPYGVIGPVSRSNGHVPIVAPRATVNDLDSIPIPDYDDYFAALQNSSIRDWIIPGLPVETSRGCWWGQRSHCTFCGLNGNGMTYRAKSTTRVIEEFAEIAQRYGIQSFEVVDNILSLEHLKEVLPALSQIEVPYKLFYETKANLDRQQMQQLSSAGVCWIQPGIESLHDSVLKLMRKGNNGVINVRLLKWAKEFGIRLSWSILCNFPGESDEWYLEMAEWLPWIFHLQPPGGMNPIRYDRFSPYYEKPEDFGIEIRPFRTYSYIYPVSSQAIANLAYFFEDAASQESQQPLIVNEFSRPGLEATRKQVQEWKQLFWSDERPLLRMEDEGERLKIIDSRPCASQPVIYLEGLSQKIYLLCDRGLTSRELLKALRQTYGLTLSWNELQPAIDQLQTYKILINLSHRFLSIAVAGEMPALLASQDFPGGHIFIPDDSPTDITEEENLCLELISSLLDTEMLAQR